MATWISTSSQPTTAAAPTRCTLGPASPAARASQRNGARRGLNENYARELLELHTLGVNGGYTQEDVQQLARILTGWTIDGVGRAAMQTIPARSTGRGRGAVRRTAPEPGSPIEFEIGRAHV